MIAQKKLDHFSIARYIDDLDNGMGFLHSWKREAHNKENMWLRDFYETKIIHIQKRRTGKL